jgi:hypothetical protein
MEYSTHIDPVNNERERLTDYDSLRKKVMMDLYNEKRRQYIRDLPLHERIKYINKIMKDEYGLPVKNH